MSAHADIAQLGVAKLVDAYRLGALSPVTAIDAYFARIDRFNPGLNAFLAFRAADANSEAIASAARWRAGKPLSSIDGVPYGAKANIAVNGLPWHGGVGAYAERIADFNADVVKKLNAAGAIPLGILNMHEGALGATTDNPHFGTCHNPWGDQVTPGGSSGGSGASVAAGLCAFALGTDTMGSVRIPSAYCGISGYKPSYGRVSAEGLVDLSPTLDHVGPHTRSARDLALVANVFAELSPNDDNSLIRIGVAEWCDAVDVEPEIKTAFGRASEMLEGIAQVSMIDISGFAFGALRRKGLLVSEVEGFAAHCDMLKKNPNGFSEEFRSMLEWGADQPPEKIDAAYSALRQAGEDFASFFKDVDIIVTPTAPQGPFGFSDPVPANQADFTAIANFGGFPAVAVPACREGTPPASIQFIANKGNDCMALRAARAFEEVRGEAAFPPGYF